MQFSLSKRLFNKLLQVFQTLKKFEKFIIKKGTLPESSPRQMPPCGGCAPNGTCGRSLSQLSSFPLYCFFRAIGSLHVTLPQEAEPELKDSGDGKIRFYGTFSCKSRQASI